MWTKAGEGGDKEVLAGTCLLVEHFSPAVTASPMATAGHRTAPESLGKGAGDELLIDHWQRRWTK